MRSYYSESKQLSKETILDYFREKWEGKVPVFKTFENNSGRYLYDTGTGKILQCDAVNFQFLKLVSDLGIYSSLNELVCNFGRNETLNSVQELIDAMESEKVLLGFSDKFAFSSQHFEGLDKLMDNDMGHIVLEVTEGCNLRCAYCIHNDNFDKARDHGSKGMETDVAFRAIDYMVEHSSNKKDLSVTFYGGEPLLRPEFVKECINYARQKAGSKPVSFSMTTNAVLITEEIADFLYNERISMNVSIDGPEDIHDSCRVDVEGEGTFSRAMRGLKMLVDRYGDRSKEFITLSMVYTPPFYIGKLDKIAAMWEQYPWLGGILPAITYTQPGSFDYKEFSDSELIEEQTISQWMRDEYLKDYKAKKESNLLLKEVAVQTLLKLLRMPNHDEPLFEMHLNGCCLPGVRKLYITVNGDMRLCERVSDDTPIVGNVFDGLNRKVTKEIFVDEYGKASEEKCSNCWSNKLCWLCYTEAYSENKLDMEMKDKACNGMRTMVENNLCLYTLLMEIDPQGLNFMGDIELS